MNHIEIDSFSTYIPRNNLPTKTSSRNTEKEFVEAFRKTYLSRQKKHGICGKELAISGFGIADLVYADISSSKKQTKVSKITAFEMKLDNWKKAINQTYRYSYFADRAIAVLPPGQTPTDKKTLKALKTMGIGLWVFNRETSTIHKLITPNKSRARLLSAREKACSAITSHLQD